MTLTGLFTRIGWLAFACAAIAALGACQQAPDLAPTREAPDRAGPFGELGYRNMKPDPIPQTEIPNAEMKAFADCANGRDTREAARWVRDWFAATSRLDQCDEWAIGVLAGPGIRRSLAFILERTIAENKEVPQCKEATYRVFTLIEENHGRLNTWRNVLMGKCTAARLQEVVAKREQAFQQGLTSLSDGISQFKGK